MDFQSSVQNRMSNSLESVWCGINKIAHYGLKSVLNQSSLGNELGSAVEIVLTFTYLNNKPFHTQVCRPVLTQHCL